MEQDGEIRDRVLVGQCLEGSKAAWDEFYARYLPLVRKVIHSHLRRSESDVQDMTQNIFLALWTALRTYDHQYPLSRFVWVVGERVCIDEYRKTVAGKRDGEHVPVNHHDHGDVGATMVRSDLETQEDEVARSELVRLLRLAFGRLGDKCRELLRLRYIEELSFKEIVPLLGAKEKTLAVQAGRCIDDLKTIYDRGQREGWR
ncbi:MAG: RNA polymerase sigma factor [Desulfomonilaceae bacterium]